jgi:hypothetical protein
VTPGAPRPCTPGLAPSTRALPGSDEPVESRSRSGIGSGPWLVASQCGRSVLLHHVEPGRRALSGRQRSRSTTRVNADLSRSRMIGFSSEDMPYRPSRVCAPHVRSDHVEKYEAPSKRQSRPVVDRGAHELRATSASAAATRLRQRMHRLTKLITPREAVPRDTDLYELA